MLTRPLFLHCLESMLVSFYQSTVPLKQIIKQIIKCLAVDEHSAAPPGMYEGLRMTLYIFINLGGAQFQLSTGL